jgi:hypothetical protein
MYEQQQQVQIGQYQDENIFNGEETKVLNIEIQLNKLHL